MGTNRTATSGGNWGSFGTSGETCRVTWFDGEPANKQGRGARVTFDKGDAKCANKIIMRVLDGIADDSFDVYVREKWGYCGWMDWEKVYHYDADPSTTEYWVEHEIDYFFFPMATQYQIGIVALGDAWSGFGTYGQLGVDWIKLGGKILNKETLMLYEKDASWQIVPGGAQGQLDFTPVGSKIYGEFEATGLEQYTWYSLIVYDDPYPGNNPGTLLAKVRSDFFGDLSFSGSKEINRDIVNSKIWLVKSSDYDAATNSMIAFNPSEYLFENNLISYDDTDI
jgi:hypothetical protein